MAVTPEEMQLFKDEIISAVRGEMETRILSAKTDLGAIFQAQVQAAVSPLATKVEEHQRNVEKFKQDIIQGDIEVLTSIDTEVKQEVNAVTEAMKGMKRIVESLQDKIKADETHLNEAIGGLHHAVEELERKAEEWGSRQSYAGDPGSGNKTKWDMNDPKMRGTDKFAGDKKQDVKVFKDWKKKALIYVDKFFPALSKVLKKCERAEWPLPDPAKGLHTAEAVFYEHASECGMSTNITMEEINQAVHGFLNEHLTDDAADVVEEAGPDCFKMWRLLHEYYEPQTVATVGTMHAAVSMMAGRKAKNAAECYELLLEFDRRHKKLINVKCCPLWVKQPGPSHTNIAPYGRCWHRSGGH